MKRNAVLITGANGGIGKSLCDRFSRSGYYVIATDISEKECCCDQYVAADLNLLVIDEDFRKIFFGKIHDRLHERNLKGIINNAAIQIVADIVDIKAAELQLSMNVNAIAPFLLIKGLMSNLETASGSVVNIGSIHTKLTKPGFTSYAASKSALSGLTRSLAVELGEKVRINEIRPAATDTEMLKDGFKNNPSGYAALKQFHPLNRLASPDEAASLAYFLVSEESSFISGSVISIDGGIGCRLHDPE